VRAFKLATIALVVLALAHAVIEVDRFNYRTWLPAAAAQLGSVTYYATWLAAGGIYALGWPELGATPWRFATMSRLDIAIAAVAAFVGLVMYTPHVITIVTLGYTPFRLDFLGGGVAGPIVEEWLFRGLLWNQLDRIGGPAANLLAGSLIFGAFHLSFEGYTTTALLNVFGHAAFGFAMGALRWRTGSLLPGTLVHLAGNLMARFAMA